VFNFYFFENRAVYEIDDNMVHAG